MTSAPTSGAGDGAARLAEVGNDHALFVFASGIRLPLATSIPQDSRPGEVFYHATDSEPLT